MDAHCNTLQHTATHCDCCNRLNRRIFNCCFFSHTQTHTVSLSDSLSVTRVSSPFLYCSLCHSRSLAFSLSLSRSLSLSLSLSLSSALSVMLAHSLCCSLAVSLFPDWLWNTGGSYMKGPLGVAVSAIKALWLQCVSSGVGTSKSCGSTNKAIHAVFPFNFPQVFQSFRTASCPRHPHHQHIQYFNIHYFSNRSLRHL